MLDFVDCVVLGSFGTGRGCGDMANGIWRDILDLCR